MLRILDKMLKEKRQVRRILAPVDYHRWLRCLLVSLPRVLRQRSLGPVDEALGGTYAVRYNGRLLRLQETSFGVVREIFGHECYGRVAELALCRQVLDLGANAGVFGLFALVNAPQATVRMVEAQAAFVPVLGGNMARNGYADRARIENALVGGEQNDWARRLRQQHPGLRDFSMRDYLADVGECDFLKCDIEGAEYAFFGGDLSWSSRVRRISLEYHGTWEQGRKLGDHLRAAGYTVVQAPHGTLGYLHASRT